MILCAKFLEISLGFIFITLKELIYKVKLIM
jgi:hypothetical protein